MNIKIITFLVFLLFFGHSTFAQIFDRFLFELGYKVIQSATETKKGRGRDTNSDSKKQANYLYDIENSKYSVFIDEKLAKWKEKGEFEKTASWQKRLADSTALKRAEIEILFVDEFAKSLHVTDGYLLNSRYYDSEGSYDADREALLVNTSWGKTAIPIPLEKAKSMQNDLRYINRLEVDFFIQNDKLALLSLTYKGYTYENPSMAAQNALREKRAIRDQIAMQLANKKKEMSTEKSEEKNGQIVIAQKDSDVFETVEQPPSFPGGESAMYDWLSKNINYPVIAQENNIQGRVTCRFIVERNGEIEDVKVVRGVDPSLDREAVRVIKSMPNWISGRQGGNAVRVRYTLPIQFRL